jgi:hypothetical protein
MRVPPAIKPQSWQKTFYAVSVSHVECGTRGAFDSIGESIGNVSTGIDPRVRRIK